MGLSQDYPDIPDWVEKPEGYKADEKVKFEGNVFVANFWASKPGEGEANKNGWRLYDELYDVTSSPAAGPARIIGYIPTWRKAEGFDYANKEMYRNVTHGIISFLMFSEANLGEFEPKSVSDVEAILADVVLTAHECGTYISIAIGGATDYGFLYLMERIGSNPSDPLLQSAVKKVVDFVDKYGLDGVDLDLECWWDKNSDPNKDQGGRVKDDGAHAAGKGLTEFAKQLRQAMPNKLISAALFATSWYGNCYDPGLVEQVDWLGLMTYDLTGSWNQTPVGPQTALHKIRDQKGYAEEQQGDWPGNRKASENKTDPMSDNPILSVEDSLWYWTNPFFTNWQGKGQNLPRNKMAAGVPIYGYDFAYGKDPDDLSGQVAPGYKTIRYKDLISQFPEAPIAANANIKVPGNTPRPPFISGGGSYPYAHNIYFETPDTAVKKLDFLKRVGAQGVIIWELSNDVWEGGKSIVQALYSNSGNPATRPALPSKPIPKPEPEPKPEPDESPFPWDLIGIFPEWSEAVPISSAPQSAATSLLAATGDDDQLQIKGSPAIASFDGKLFCVYHGNYDANDQSLWWATSTDGDTWVGQGRMEVGVTGSPALAEYNGKLYCVHEGFGQDGLLSYCSFDGQEWSKDKKLSDKYEHGVGAKRDGFPSTALCVYNDKLYCLHEGQKRDGYGQMWWCTFDGQEWSKDEKLVDRDGKDCGTSGAPGLVAIDNALYCFHEGADESGELWWTFYNGTEWYKDRPLTSQSLDDVSTLRGSTMYTTSGTPGVARYGDQIFLVHQGRGDDGWLWTFSNEDKTDEQIAAGANRGYAGISFSPGLALYNNAFYVMNQGRGRDGLIYRLRSAFNDQQRVAEYNLAMPERRQDRPGPPYAPLDRYNTRLTEHQPLDNQNNDYPVAVMRHHIIPDATLVRLWNTMLEQGHLHIAAGELLIAIEQNVEGYEMNLNPADRAGLIRLLQDIRNRRIRHNPTADRPDHFDDLIAVYEWMPGNLFIGPSSGDGEYGRTDDPGDGFEENGNTVVGADEPPGFPHREAYSAIGDYLLTGAEEDAQRAFAGLSAVARLGIRPFAINPLDWIYAHGRYQLRRREF